MNEQDYFNEQQDDVERFKNFVKVILLIAGVMIGMIATNYFFN